MLGNLLGNLYVREIAMCATGNVALDYPLPYLKNVSMSICYLNYFKMFFQIVKKAKDVYGYVTD